MSLRILVSGHIVRYPLGGQCWHHLQYLVGLARLGHQVHYYEDYGWPASCYDPEQDTMSADPTYGIRFLRDLLKPHGLSGRWCYLAEDGSTRGLPRAQLAECCRQADLYINLSNLNWIDELEECSRRVLIDTDPVFTQIGAIGMGGAFEQYHRLFTFGENVHQPGCSMPTAGYQWLPTRQPIVADLWPVTTVPLHGDLTTLTNVVAYGDHTCAGVVYGQKDREFAQFVDLPSRVPVRFRLALAGGESVQRNLVEHGWSIDNPLEASRSPQRYQQYIRDSLGEWCVAKHGYVSTASGWFSERSAAYLASGRPVVVQDTGFSRSLPHGEGLFGFNTIDEAVGAIEAVLADPQKHGNVARRIALEHFDAEHVLNELLTRAMN